MSTSVPAPPPAKKTVTPRGNKVKVSTEDGDDFEIDRDLAVKSTVIRNVLQDTRADDDEAIPLMNVSTPCFKKVLEWLELHRGDIEPLDENDERRRALDFSEEDKRYLNTMENDNEMLCDVILAANYLHIQPLLDLTCKKVAMMMKGKSPQEIRDLFNIVNDFTPEEEEQIRRENEWAEER